MVLGSTRDKAVVQLAYIASSVVIIAIAYVISPSELGLGALLSLAIFFTLGPLGLIAFAFLVFQPLLLLAPGSGFSLLALMLIIPVAAGVAFLNISIVFGYFARGGTDSGSPGAIPDDTVGRRVLVPTLFIVAGFLFVLLTGVAVLLGILGAMADSGGGGGQAVRVLGCLTWFPGLIVAVGGLAIWIVNGVRRRRLLRWAIADASIQLGLLVVAVVGILVLV